MKNLQILSRKVPTWTAGEKLGKQTSCSTPRIEEWNWMKGKLRDINGTKEMVRNNMETTKWKKYLIKIAEQSAGGTILQYYLSDNLTWHHINWLSPMESLWNCVEAVTLTWNGIAWNEMEKKQMRKKWNEMQWIILELKLIFKTKCTNTCLHTNRP